MRTTRAATGNLEAEVEEAFDELIREGVEPSVRKIRERVGYGSHTDITSVLSSLKAEAAVAAAALAQMPDSLIDKRDRFTALLWGAMQIEARSVVDGVRTACAERIATVEADLAGALADADAMQKKLDDASGSVRHFSDSLAEEMERHAKTRTDLDVSRTLLGERTAQIEALQRILAGTLTLKAGLPAPMLTLAPIVARVEKAMLKALAEGGPVPPDKLDDRISGLGAFTGTRLRKVVDQLIASGRLQIDGEGRVIAAANGTGS